MPCGSAQRHAREGAAAQSLPAGWAALPGGAAPWRCPPQRHPGPALGMPGAELTLLGPRTARSTPHRAPGVLRITGAERLPKAPGASHRAGEAHGTPDASTARTMAGRQPLMAIVEKCDVWRLPIVKRCGPRPVTHKSAVRTRGGTWKPAGSILTSVLLVHGDRPPVRHTTVRAPRQVPSPPRRASSR